MTFYPGHRGLRGGFDYMGLALSLGWLARMENLLVCVQLPVTHREPQAPASLPCVLGCLGPNMFTSVGLGGILALRCSRWPVLQAVPQSRVIWSCSVSFSYIAVLDLLMFCEGFLCLCSRGLFVCGAFVVMSLLRSPGVRWPHLVSWEVFLPPVFFEVFGIRVVLFLFKIWNKFTLETIWARSLL